jgi:endonuclease/exonuclease/phosphatase family metal-dependent hydrolase
MKRNVPPKVLASTLFLSVVTACSGLHAGSGGVPDRALRVMTYNIEAGNSNLERIADVIRANGAQIVALQEVDVHWAERSNFTDEAQALATSLGMQMRFAPIYHFPGSDSTKPPREYGVALLSRYTIEEWVNHELSRLSTQQQNPIPAEMPGFLEATINFRGTRIRVFNTHLDYRSDPRVRQQQVLETLRYIGESSTPTLLFGDLNAPPDAPELQPLRARLRDAWPAPAGPGFTYPSNAPVRRIDYVLTSPHFLVRDAKVPETIASDHRPVVIDLELVH